MKTDFIKDKVVDIPTIDGIISERVKDGEYTSKYVQINRKKLVRELMNERTRNWLSNNASKYGCIYTEEV